MDAEESQLYEAVYEALKERGVVEKLSCQVRAEILRVLKGSEIEKDGQSRAAAESSENFILNELIKEYLDYNGYRHTADVLAAESGRATNRRSTRVDLEKTLGIHCGPNAKQVPLLYGLLSSFRR